ncbi:MAG: hypothetical protein IKR09_09525 [Alphaproteobacteria bacterium]|nr:hypothetical protein [Alphaproteobacteria bacterium]
MTSFINSFFKENKTALFSFLIFGCICGGIARYEFAWWDAANYHYYNPWAFLNDRMNIDIVPAVINSFFSPFVDFPYYFLVNALNEHPVIFCVVMSIPYGLMLFFTYKIATLFFSNNTTQGQIRIGLTVLLGICSENVFFQICSSSHEHLLSFLILASLYLLLKEIKTRRFSVKHLVFSAFILGAAAGLKLTYAPYAAATGTALIVFHKQLNIPLKNILYFSLGGIAGFLVSYGYWGWILWKNFQNPFFPFFNSVFPSPKWLGADYKDIRYFNKPWFVLVFYPFLLFFNLKGLIPLTNGTIIFSNLRLVVGGVIFLGTFVKIICFSKRSEEKNKNTSLLPFLMFWMTIVYIFWIIIFRVYRYMIPFELLLSIVLVDFIFKDRKIHSNDKRLLFFISFLAVVTAAVSTNYGLFFTYPYNTPLLPKKAAPLPDDTLLVIRKIPGAILVPLLAKNSTVRAIVDPDIKRKFNGSDFHRTGFFAEKAKSLLEKQKNEKKPIAYLTYRNAGSLCSPLEVFGSLFSLCWETDYFIFKPSTPINIWLDKTDFLRQNKEKLEKGNKYARTSGPFAR